EFKEEWVRTRLGDIAVFKKGKGISKNDISIEGKTDCIRYGELYTYYDEVIEDVISTTNLNPDNLILSEENDIIIPSSGESSIEIAKASCVQKSGVALGGDLNIIKTNSYGNFLAYYLNNKKKNNIGRIAQGSSVVHLYAKQLSKLNIALPTINEQYKIGSFLNLIEKRIKAQIKII
ncbi:restriction endonuclease subunit S, partial [Christiangramia flava]